MLKPIKVSEIPMKKSPGKKKSNARVRLDEDIMDFAESEDEAAEVVFSKYDAYGSRSVSAQSSTLRRVIKDLGLKGFKVLKREDRLFVVKEDNIE